jgi:hypothetical protein
MPRKEFESFTRLDASDVNTYLMDQSVMTFGGTAARGSAITTPVEGMVTYLEDSNSLQLYDGDGWTSAGGVSSGNAIINGGFDIWQRGTSFVDAANGAFGADRFYVVHDGSGQRTVSRETFTPGAAPVSGYESEFFYRYNQTTAGSGGTFASIVHRIEDVRTFANQTVTFSFWAKADATRSVTVFWSQFFGSGGSSIVDTNFGTLSLTTSWVRYIVTATLPSVTGETIGTGSALQLQLALPINTTQTIDIWGVQLEAGPVATPFRRNANSLQGELAACQRYYVRYTPTDAFTAWASGAATGTTIANVYLGLPVTMRAAPTSLDFSTIALADFGGGIVAATALAIGYKSDKTIGLTVTVATGLTQHRPVQLFSNNSTSAFIGFSAEL